MAQYTTHAQQDALLTSNSAALPNAGNSVNTSVIDLGAAKPFPTTGRVTAQLVSTQSTGANSKNINFVIADSSDNITFTNIAVLATKVLAGNAANFPAATTNYALPPSTNRYLRARAVGEANGGDASDGTFTLKILC